MLVKREGASRLLLPLAKKKEAEEAGISGDDYGK